MDVQVVESGSERFAWAKTAGQVRTIQWHGVAFLGIWSGAALVVAVVVAAASGEAILFAPALAITGFLFLRLGSVIQPLPAYSLARDKREPILYLREFTDDYASVQDTAILLKRLQKIGPVVALSTEDLPRESPILRFVVPANEWQEAIRDLISVSRLVVFGYGASAAYEWELECAAAALEPTRVLICLPATLSAEYREYLYESQRAILKRTVGLWVPDRAEGTSFLMFTPDGHTVVFGDQGDAQVRSYDGETLDAWAGASVPKPTELSRVLLREVTVDRVVQAVELAATPREDRSLETPLRQALRLPPLVRLRESLVASLKWGGILVALIGVFPLAAIVTGGWLSLLKLFSSWFF